MVDPKRYEATESEWPRIGVLGLGNVLMGDDAFGPTVIAHVKAQLVLSPQVRVEDLGTPGLDLYSELAPLSAVVIVDTVRAQGRAGTIDVYRREDILRRPPEARTSPHDPGLKVTLLRLELARTGPIDVSLVGVVPGAVDYGVGMTEEVEAAVPRGVECLRAELERLGVSAFERRGQHADLWWASTQQEAR